MKLFHFLTIVLFLLKVLNVVQISWFIVFLPSIISIGLGILLFLLSIIIMILVNK